MAEPVRIMGSGAGEGLQARLDNYTSTLQIIEYEHHEIHAGSSFTADYNVDLPGAGVADVLLITANNTTWPHMTWEVDCELETDILIYEDATATAGTAITVFNRDRNSSKVAGMTVSHTPTSITTGNTIIRHTHLGSGKNWGGGSRSTHEIILKQNTKYLIRITNVATPATNYVSLKLDWYEHKNVI